MKAHKTDRGFVRVEHPAYVDSSRSELLVGESSAIGDYEDSWDTAGSSFLWVGEHHHLNREEVAELIRRMQQWLDLGRLQVQRPTNPIDARDESQRPPEDNYHEDTLQDE